MTENAKENRNTWLGVDLGGTKLLIAEMDDDGNLLCSKKYPSGPLNQKEALELMLACIADFLETVHPADRPMPVAMGVGMVGRIDNKSGIWYEIDPSRCEELPVAAILKERLEIPCFIDNDVRSATKAEMLFGYGRSTGNMIYINVGTGIAAGVVTGGALIEGSHCNSGEVGHTSSGVEFRAPCVCGRSDCVETVASGSGLDKCARLMRPLYPKTVLEIPEEARVAAKDVIAHYGEDEMCTALMDNAAQGIANLVMNLVRVTDPDTVVLGGGMVSDGFLYEEILKRVDPYTVRFVTKGIVLTKLNPAFIGVMGACSNAILGMRDR